MKATTPAENPSGKTFFEHTLSMAAALIRQHAPDAPATHPAYHEHEPVTGSDIADQLESELKKITDGCTLSGTIIQAGGGQPTITISTCKDQLFGKSIPLYKNSMIRITPHQ